MRSAQQRDFVLTVTDQVLLSPNPRRIMLYVGAPTAGSAQIGFQGHPTSTTGGYSINSASGGVLFKLDDMGEALQGEIHAAASAGTPTISIVEVLEG